jgi:uncharacterized membrane protein YdjX (TVP38/TMEM64 family)
MKALERATTLAPAGLPTAHVSLRKLAVVATVLAASLLVIQFSPLKSYLQDLQGFKQTVAAAGPAASIAAALAIAILVALGCPRLLLCGAAGVVFGFVTGFFVALVGQLVGSYATFVFVRWTGLHWATERLHTRPLLRTLFRAHSPLAVFVLRQVPVTSVVMNFLLGASKVRHRDFLIGTLLGYLPLGAAATLIGSGFGKSTDDAHLRVIQWTLALACFALSALIAWRMRKRLNHVNADASQPPPAEAVRGD